MSAPVMPATTTKAAGPVPAARTNYSWQRPPPRTASSRRRTAAFAIDVLAVFVLAWLLTFITAALDILRVPDITILGRKSDIAGLLWIVSIFELPLVLLYFGIAEALSGRTPGKMLFRLRVRRVDGEALSLFDSFLRNLLRLLWVTPFGVGFILYDLWSLNTTELDQRLGDRVAGTLVLDERQHPA